MGYWWAEYDTETDMPEWPWSPALETEVGIILNLDIAFATKEQCEKWIEDFVVGRELRRD